MITMYVRIVGCTCEWYIGKILMVITYDWMEEMIIERMNNERRKTARTWIDQNLWYQLKPVTDKVLSICRRQKMAVTVVGEPAGSQSYNLQKFDFHWSI